MCQVKKTLIPYCQNMQIWTYQHYKWKNYEVIWIGLHSETREKLVFYKCLYDTPELTDEFWDSPFFVRPYTMFHENTEYQWKTVKRFTYIGA